MNETRHYAAEPASVTQARRFVAEALRTESADRSEAAELMVSELATNVVRHTASDFTVHILTTGTDIRVDVTDTGGGTPEKQSPPPLQPTGRGLQIVDALSDRWEVTPGRPTGKTVSFVLALHPMTAE